jgi:hypothetical protein
MNLAAEKAYAATASRIIVRTGNCPRAFSLKMQKEHITGLLSVLPNWYQNVKYRKYFRQDVVR